MIKQNTVILWGIFLYGLLLFTVGLSHQEIIGFESRFYLFALEMWRHGASAFATTYHQPYPDYPATGILFIYGFSKLLGGLNKLTAIFPSALAAALTLVVTYQIGALQNRRLGLAAVFFLLMTNAFVTEARTISLDQYTTLITACCFYLAFSRRLLWILPLLVLGFAIRGPIGLVIPTGVLCVFYLLEKDIKYTLIVGVSAALLLLLSGMILLGFAYHAGGVEFVKSVLKMQAFGRIQDAKPLPWSFYWLESFGAYAMAYPIAILVLFGMKKMLKPQRDYFLKLVGWAGIILLGLSFPTDKKIRYILPIAPALALMSAYLFLEGQQRYFQILLKLFYSFCVIFPSLCVMLLFVIAQRFSEIQLPFLQLGVFFGVMQILQIILYGIKEKEFTAFMIASFTFVMAYILIAEPINLQLNQTRQFVQEVEAKRAQQHAQLAFYQEGTDGLVIKYLANMTRDEQPKFLYQPDELKNIQQSTFVIVSKENFQKMPQNDSAKMIDQGRIGREPFVVLMFTFKPR